MPNTKSDLNYLTMYQSKYHNDSCIVLSKSHYDMQKLTHCNTDVMMFDRDQPVPE